MILPALVLPPLAVALLALAARAQPPTRLAPGVALALIALGIHVAIAAAYGVLVLPFSGNLAFTSVSASALLGAGALVLWASRAPLDDDSDDDDRRDPDDPDPGEPSAMDWDALEHWLREREAVPA